MNDDPVVKLHDIARQVERDYRDPVGIKLAKDIRKVADELNELNKVLKQ